LNCEIQILLNGYLTLIDQVFVRQFHKQILNHFYFVMSIGEDTTIDIDGIHPISSYGLMLPMLFLTDEERNMSLPIYTLITSNWEQIMVDKEIMLP